MSVDRTKEFLAFLNENTKPNDSSNLIRQPETDLRFKQLSDSITQSVQQCADDLTSLRKYAKHRTLLDDRSREIQTLTLKIKQDLTELNRQVEDLEKIMRGPSSGSPGSQHAAAHKQAIVNSLRTRLIDIAREFREILETRSNNLRELESRREKFGQTGATRLRPAASTGSIARRSFADNSNGESDVDLEAGQQQLILPQSNAYRQSRVEAVEQIQRIVGELSQMFTRVATMVSQQEEMVLRIDSSVDESLQRIKDGQAHLLTYFHRLSSQRALILKLLGLLATFAAFFIIFLA